MTSQKRELFQQTYLLDRESADKPRDEEENIDLVLTWENIKSQVYWGAKIAKKQTNGCMTGEKMMQQHRFQVTQKP